MAVAAPSALLVFDDGTTLPASNELLMLQSPVLRGAIAVACNDQHTSPVRIALPGDSRADWVKALPYLYSAELEVMTADALAGLLQKYELAALRLALGNFLWRAAWEKENFTWEDGTSLCNAWRWLVLAANCRMEQSVVERMCKLVMDAREPVPAGFDLGLAAQPLAAMLAAEKACRKY